ncbi:MAG: hypothetical protein ACKVGW_08620 [Verrucomicrobiia bacterium]
MRVIPFLFSLVLFANATVVPSKSAQKRPNILFIFTDDHCQ